MGKSLRKELLREILKSRNRFLSIFVMVALGVMFLVGLRSAAPDMRDTSDRFFDEKNFYDVQILSTLGLTEEDVLAFSQVAGVEAAEGGFSVDAMLTLGDTARVVKVLNLFDQFDTPTVVEGRLPEGLGECALDARMMGSFSLGDAVGLTPGEEMEDAFSSGDTYTIVGFVESPEYISLDRGTSTLGDGSVSGFVLLPKECFTLDYFTLCYLRAAGSVALDAYGPDYADLMEELTDRLEVFAEERADIRKQDILLEARSEIDDAQAELDRAKADAVQELREARRELIDGQAELVDARQELDDGWADLAQGKLDYAEGAAEGQQELDDARRDLDDGWSELDDARDTLNAAQAQLNTQSASAQAQIAAAEQEIAENEALVEEKAPEIQAAEEQVAQLRQQTEGYRMALDLQNQQVADAEANGVPVDPDTLIYNEETYQAMAAALQSAEEQLREGQAQLEAGRAQIAAAKTALAAQKTAAEAQIASAQGEINSGWGDYYSGKTQLEQGEQDYAQGLLDYETELADAAQELLDGEQELVDGEADYAEGLLEYADGLAEYNGAKADVKQELTDAQTELGDAKQELAALKPADIYVLDRNSNYGFVSYDQNATRMENLARMFPLIFFLVAALVCLTTMTRMVEEERTQIGAIKAMGYGTGAIAWKFLLYGVAAALAGSVVGAVIGTTLLPWVIFTSYSIMYTLPQLHMSVHWGLCLGASAAGLLCTMGATLWAMLSTARLSPAQLMRPKAPKVGKRILLERITPLWRRMGFSAKVSARNLFRYKKRFWMTIIGVAGCTALLISGLGLRSSIFSIIDIQFDDLYRYTAQVSLDGDTPREAQDIKAYLDGTGGVDAMTALYSRSVDFETENGTADGYLRVTAEPENLYRQIDLREMGNKAHLDIPENGVILDEKLAELLDAEVGDTITVDMGKPVEVIVAGVTEHYVYHYAYMTAGYYEAVTGETYVPNELLLTTTDTSDEGISRLCEGLMEQDHVRSASNMGSSARSFRDNMQAVNAAVVIIIVSAAALALVVLYNLTNINITERIRELATIKVLGFYDGEVAMYIYRENIVLTLLGIALGQVGGKFLCTYLVRTIEMDIVMFGREALWQNYILSVVLSLVFAVLVNVMMYFRMKKIDMVESLKSVE